MAGVVPEAIHSVTRCRILDGFLSISYPRFVKYINPWELYTIAVCFRYRLFVCQVLIRSFDLNSADAVLMQESSIYGRKLTEQLCKSGVETPLNLRKSVFNCG